MKNPLIRFHLFNCFCFYWKKFPQNRATTFCSATVLIISEFKQIQKNTHFSMKKWKQKKTDGKLNSVYLGEFCEYFGFNFMAYHCFTFVKCRSFIAFFYQHTRNWLEWCMLNMNMWNEIVWICRLAFTVVCYLGSHSENQTNWYSGWVRKIDLPHAINLLCWMKRWRS